MTGEDQWKTGVSNRVRDAIDRAFLFLDESVNEQGVWLGHYANVDDPIATRALDANPFVAALGSLSIEKVKHPLVNDIVNRSRAYVITKMLSTGIWRYWPTLPPDADSTSICNVFVGFHPVLFKEWFKLTLLAYRNKQGLFNTWLTDLPTNDPDAVVNANVIACLGDISETQSAQAWLEKIIQEGTDVPEIHYYWDSLDLYRAIVRTHCLRKTVFEGILETVGERVRARRNNDGSYGDGLRTCLAVTTLADLRKPLSECDAQVTISRLLDLQMDDGGWPESPHASGPFWPQPRRLAYMSRAFDTAACIEALSQLAASAEDDGDSA